MELSSLVISIAALTLALTSTLFSIWFNQKQLVQFKKENHFPVVAEVFAKFQKAEFHDQYDYVVNRLRHDHDPSHGLLGLPQPAKDWVIDQAYFYQTLAALKGLNVLDETDNLGNLHLRIVEVWTAIEPYVDAERRRTRGANRRTLEVLQKYAETERARR